jgi:hypothetical protein
MINTENSKIGNPFPFRVFCQKVIPLAFDESMSYLELLYSLLHYLKETVIPAVNNNADAVTELQNLYNELKSYVDNYFENLDIQEEINNKLDEMAESGQLAEIISLYLDYNLLQCYNTNAELKQSTSLNNGSFARTYGKLTYNDGYGAFYKIRQRTNQDEPDDDNLIVLVNTENLIAEKMKNQYLIDTKNNLQNEINKLKNKRIVCIGDSYSITDNQPSQWINKFQELTGISNIITNAKGGVGFCNVVDETNFNILLNNVASSDDVTDIICVGGYNDSGYSQEDIEYAINLFCQTAKSKFPNAKIYIGMVAWCFDYTKTFDISNKVLTAYQNCKKYGAIYLNGVENILHDTSLLQNDNFHPTLTDGMNELGYGIFQSWNNGYCEISRGYRDLPCSTNSIFANNFPNPANKTIGNTTTIIQQNDAYLVLNNSINNLQLNNANIKICDIQKGGYVSTNNYGLFNIPVSLHLKDTNDYWYNCFGHLVLINNEIRLQITSTDANNGYKTINLQDIIIDKFTANIPTSFI